MTVSYLVYRSDACCRENSQQDASIFEQSARNNAVADVTGFLHREQGRYLQHLEGPEDAVEATFARIARDARHRNVMVLERGVADSRRFEDWRMGYTSEDDVSFSDFLQASGKRRGLTEATAEEVVGFLAGACQILQRGRAV